ncbi:MAG: amidase [Chloroflexi bacterium]|nr:amidase [Chloroflexota bacterium]
MAADELCWLSAAELADRIARRELSPVEVVEAHLARAERLNPELNAFLTVTADHARAAARQAEQELATGGPRGPLHGVPFAVKDIVATRGIRTTMGSRLYADFVPDEDATVVERLRAAGGILLAKAHTHEFARGATTNSPYFGPCRNPWDSRRVPGGSSGGSGSSVSAGLCPIAIGTDTGGSIRNPAAVCGVVGLKPTYGLVSRHAVHPASWTLDTVGPLTRTVRDAAITLGALAGYDPRDRTTGRAPIPHYLAALTGDVRGLRIGLLRDHLEAPMDAEVRTSVTRAIERLRELGATLDDVRIPSLPHAPVVSAVIVEVESGTVHERNLRERPADFAPDVLHRLLWGFGIDGLDYVKAQRARTLITAEVAGVLQRFDVLVGPTVAIPAPEIDRFTTEIDGQERRVLDLLSCFTRLDNLTGYPAISIPCGYTAAGLPIGLQISGRPLEDATVLGVADAYERATADERRRPDDLPSATSAGR